jgi:dTMP kinase
LRGLKLEPRPVSGGARRGLFIVFEGVEGAGKTTQMKALYDYLSERDHEVVVTREPGGTPIAERIRGLVLDPAAKEMDPKTEALLYAASRAQHAAEVIRPALARGAVVLCDRYLDSSLAYQGVARGLGIDDVYRLNVWGTDELLPDLVVLLNLDPQTGLSRTRGMPDRMEQESVDFHRKVGAAYLELARIYPSRFCVIDASLDAEKVQEEVRHAVSSLLATVQS